MGNWIQDMLGTGKALIGLCHFPALPRDPLYDEGGRMVLYHQRKVRRQEIPLYDGDQKVRSVL